MAAVVMAVWVMAAWGGIGPAEAQESADRDLAVSSGAGTGGGVEAEAASRPVLGPSGLPLPRFVSLRAEPVNMRSGPGRRYPVAWILTRRGLPLQVIAEYDTWRKVRDPEGAEGWIHQSMLTGRRTVMALAEDTLLRRDPMPQSQPIARIGAGVIGNLLACPGGQTYCRVDMGGYLGWLPRGAVFGLSADEVVE